jgi:proteasome lid subunit RPN8/RPN11
VLLPVQIRDAIVAHAAWAYPREGCGLLAADESGSLRMAYCLTNVADSSYRFTVDPVEQFHAIRHAERLGWHIAGAFHSHPRSEASPSAADIAGALDPTWIHLIAGPVGDDTPLRAYTIRDGLVTELELQVAA